MVRRLLRLMAWALLTPLLLFLLVFALLYVPPIQSFIREKTTTMASEATGMQIGIRSIRLAFPLDLRVQGVEVVDTPDTLIRAEELRVKVQMLPLFLQRLEIDGVALKEVHVNTASLIEGVHVEGSLGHFDLRSHGVDLSKETVVLNRVALSDARLRICLNDSTPAELDTAATDLRWKIRLHELRLERVEADVDMPADSMALRAVIGTGHVREGLADLGTGGYELEALCLSDGEVRYDLGERNSCAGFDPNHIWLRHLQMELADLSYQGTSATASIRTLSMEERSGLNLVSLTGELVADSSRIRVPSLKLKTPYSCANLMAMAEWRLVDNLQEGMMSVQMDADLGKEDLMLFLGHLSDDFHRAYPYRPLMLRADVDGNMARLNINQLRAELPGAFQAEIKGKAAALLDSVARTGSMECKVRTGNLNFLLTLLDDASRQALAVPLSMSLDGQASMKGERYEANLQFRENQAKVDLCGYMDGRSESYEASLDVDSLMLTDFLPKDSLRRLSARLKAKGVGFDPFSRRTRMEAEVEVSEFSYGNYDLSDVALKASLTDCRAEATLGCHNPLVDMDSKLKALFEKNKVSARLDLDMWNADLYAMKLMENPLDLGFSLRMQATSDLEQTHQIEGSMSDIRMQLAQGAFQPKNIYLDAFTDCDTVQARVRAGDMEISLAAGEGMERLLAQTTSLMDVLNEQLESRQLNQAELKTYFPRLCLRVSAGTDNPLSNTLTGFSGADFQELLVEVDTSPDDGIYADSHVYALGIDSLQLDTVYIRMRQDTACIRMQAGAINGPQNKQISFRSLAEGELGNNRMNLLLQYFNAEGDLGVNLGLRAMMRREGVSFHFYPEAPTVVYRPFRLNPRNFIYVGKDMHVRANVSMLDSAGTGVRLYSLPCDTTVLQDMALEIRRIELADICEIAPYMPKLSGLFTAETHLVQTQQSIQLAADVQMEDFCYEGSRLGDMGLEAVYLPGEGGEHYVDARLSHEGKEVLGVGGMYDAAGEGALDAEIEVVRFPLCLADGFVPDRMAQLKGYLSGELNVRGLLDKPTMNGELRLDSAATQFPQFGVRLRMDSQPLRVQDNKLVFDKYRIYTRNENPFIVDGQIDMNNFVDMTADLRLMAQNYELINAPKSRESMLYGKVYVDVFARVKGALDAPQVRGNINLLGNTNVTYVMGDSPLTAAQDRLGELVTFANFNDTTAVLQDEQPKVALGGMNMLMVVHVDQAARVNAELSADGSDYVRLEGGGDLSLQYTEYEGLRLNGRYTLSSGQMKYALIVGLSREFSIKNGSYVDFSGDPMNPKLNIIAIYKNRTSVTEDDAQRMVTFHASIAITNTLENLGLAFNLEAPEDGTIQNELAAMSDEDRSRLAVTMIALGIYQGAGSSGFDMGSSMNSVLNGAIKGITNNIKAVDISLGVETGDRGSGSHTDYSYQISKRFWNDRFNIIIGGTISTGENAQQGQQTFIDNISVEYRLDNSGTRYVRLFHDKNYDSILDGEVTETGVGVVLRKKMSRLGELFIFRRKKSAMVPAPPKETKRDEKM